MYFLIMKPFYNFFTKNSKLLISFLLIAGLHIFLILNLNKKAQVVDETFNLRKIHKLVQDKVSENMLEVCDIFNNQKSTKSITRFFEEKGYGYHLDKTKIIRFENLLFSEILFKSYDKKKQEISVSSTGYLVENIKTSKCFGLL